MKRQRVSDAPGQVDERYIIEAAPAEENRKHGRVKWASMVASLCLVVVGGGFAFNSMSSEEAEKQYTASGVAEISSNYNGVLLANNLSFTDAGNKKIL